MVWVEDDFDFGMREENDAEDEVMCEGKNGTRGRMKTYRVSSVESA